MKCPYCGAENADNAVFCVNCDRWILGEYFIEPQPPAEAAPDAEQTGAPSRKSAIKSLFPAVAGILVLIVGILIFLWPGAQPGQVTTGPTSTGKILGTVPDVPHYDTLPPTTSPPADDPATDYVQCRVHIGTLAINDQLAFIIGNSYVQTTLPYTEGTDVATSLDGTIGAYLTEGTLIYIRDGAVQQIAENVSSYELSISGDGLAYMDGDGGLRLYRDGQSIAIDQAEGYRIKSFAISPDGKTVAYSTHVFTSGIPCDDGLLLYRDGETTVLGTLSTGTVLGVSEGGEWVYYYDGSVLKIVDAQGNVTDLGKPRLLLSYGDFLSSSLSSYIEEMAMVHFSADHRQMLYHLESGAYLSENGQPGQKISDFYLTPIVPEMTQVIETSSATTYPHRDLRQKLYQIAHLKIPCDEVSELSTVHSIYHLGTSCQEIASDVEDFWLDPTGKYLYCKYSDGTLARIEDTQTGNFTSTVIAVNADDFVASNDCSQVYYRVEDQLYRSDAAGDMVVAIDVSSDAQLFLDADGTFAYYDKGQLKMIGRDIRMVGGVSACFLSENRRLYCYSGKGSVITFVNGDYICIW